MTDLAKLKEAATKARDTRLAHEDAAVGNVVALHRAADAALEALDDLAQPYEDTILALLSRLSTAEGERDRMAGALRECRDRLSAFVGATAEVTDCSADVDALKRADAALGGER